ncbi:hypothetical protein GQ457_10G026030 [Hibiscus cannabinus]
MKKFQVSAILFMMLLHFAAGQQPVESSTREARKCGDMIKMEGCKNQVCKNSCKEKHGDGVGGACFGAGCLCVNLC